MSVLKDLVTCKDGESHDLARWVMLLNAIMLGIVLVLGVAGYFYGWLIVKPFDVQTLFTSVLTYVGGVGALLTSGAAALFFKRSTEPNEETPAEPKQ